MILDSLLSITEDSLDTYHKNILFEADDYGDGTGPNNDDDDDNFEVSDDDNGDDDQGNDDQGSDNNDGEADTQSADDDESFEITDDGDGDSEQSNDGNSDDASAQSEDQNTGDQDNGDDNQDNTDDNQDSSDQGDDQNTDDDNGDGDDDYEISDDDDSDGGDDGGTDDGGTDATSDDSDSGDGADTSGGDTGSDDDPRSKLNELEKSIFDQLSPDQQQAKTLELKGLFQMAYNNCQKIIDSISATEANPTNTKVFDYIVSRLTDLKGYITDYLNDVFDSKGYLENMTEFQKYLAIFDTIKNTFEDIQKEDNKAQ